MKSCILLMFFCLVLVQQSVAQCSGSNLIVNGNFSAGNTGFTTSYTYNATSCYVEGDYSISTAGSNVHSAFCSLGDHTSGTGNYMIVNGAPSVINVWCQSTTVTANIWYRFSMWGMNVCASCGDSPAFSISINSSPANNPCATFVFTPGCSWKSYETFWFSGSNTSATICITNLNTYLGGNDFALDDIAFNSCLTVPSGCIAFPLQAPVLQSATVNEALKRVDIRFVVDENLRNNTTLELERAVNKDHFVSLGQLTMPAEHTNEGVFEDIHPIANEESFYRIKATTRDGKQEYSRILSTTLWIEEERLLSTYPNPLTQNQALNLSYLSPKSQNLNATWLDSQGRVLEEQNIHLHTGINTLTIPSPPFSTAGMYLLLLKTNQQYVVQKIMVQP